VSAKRALDIIAPHVLPTDAADEAIVGRLLAQRLGATTNIRVTPDDDLRSKLAAAEAKLARIRDAYESELSDLLRVVREECFPELDALLDDPGCIACEAGGDNPELEHSYLGSCLQAKP
jgi:hypothetical protein